MRPLPHVLIHKDSVGNIQQKPVPLFVEYYHFLLIETKVKKR